MDEQGLCETLEGAQSPRREDSQEPEGRDEAQEGTDLAKVSFEQPRALAEAKRKGPRCTWSQSRRNGYPPKLNQGTSHSSAHCSKLPPRKSPGGWVQGPEQT